MTERKNKMEWLYGKWALFIAGTIGDAHWSAILASLSPVDALHFVAWLSGKEKSLFGIKGAWEASIEKTSEEAEKP